MPPPALSATSTNDRVSVKENAAQATRKAMTERRQELTNRIRKQKKSALLARRRRFFQSNSSLSGGSSDDDSKTDASIIDLSKAFVQSRSVETLARLSSVLSSTVSNSATAGETLLKQDETLSVRLAESLGEVLVCQQGPKERLYAARILTNLAATNTIGSNSAQESSYYGRPPPSWPNLLLHSQMVLQSLHRVFEEQNEIPLLQQCCWTVGNLASDAPHESLLSYCDPLLKLLQRALYEWKDTFLCRNILWALSNLARGAHTSSRPFVQSNLLTTELVAHILMSPEHQKQYSQQQKVSWTDVAYEMAWLIAYLTAKEDETVGHLMAASESVSFSSQQPVLVCEGLACRLDQAVRRVRHSPSLGDEETKSALKMTLPIIRAVGNIGSTGRFLVPLMQSHDESIVRSLASLIEVGSFPASRTHQDLATVATEATWAAGTLLCDAGMLNHVSTVLAVPHLLPKLVLCITSPQSTLILKREALQALWNTLAAPPQEMDMGSVWSTRATRDDFLDDMVKADKKNFLVCLVELLDSYDHDVVVGAVQLVNAFLRRKADSYKIYMEEAGVVESLERICDKASTDLLEQYPGGGESPAADIAADLLDDVFEEQLIQHGDTDGEHMHVAPFIEGNTFAFGTEQQQQHSAFEFVQPPMGRGRGKPVPAWMSQQQQHHR